jgi:biotin carboxylase
MISPGYPPEMPLFTRGLSEAGARVLGIGDAPEGALAPSVRQHLAGYLAVQRLWEEAQTVRAVRAWTAQVGRIDRVECLWEPGMILAARVREALGLPGMTVAETVPFRDKAAMKDAIHRAGLRAPRHRRATSEEGVREAAEAIGYPLIVKPIAGAGSADTYRCGDRDDLERALAKIRHVPEVNVEEFVEGEEFTYDTICAGGRILFQNVCWYRPSPLVQRSNEWISPQTVALRDLGVPYLQPGIDLGRRVIDALGFRDGFTHMEWFRTAKGEAVFGEIGARPPGARTVDVMNHACDTDLFRAWAEAILHGRIPWAVERRYNCASIFKRAKGEGTIRRIEGLDRLRRELEPWIVHVDLVPVGSPRRDWRQTLLSDGIVILRHPLLAECLRMADRVGRELQLFAA